MRWMTGRILALLLPVIAAIAFCVEISAKITALPFLFMGRAFKFVARLMRSLLRLMRSLLYERLSATWPSYFAEGRSFHLEVQSRARQHLAHYGPIIGLPMALVVVLAVFLYAIFWIWQGTAALFERLGRSLQAIGKAIRNRLAKGRMRPEIRRFQSESRKITRDVTAFSAEQQKVNPLDANRKTIFILITCGQAVRNFLLSDVFSLLRTRFNVVILTTYAYSEGFRKEYSLPGVHVLPWFSSFRTVTERLFQYYFMSKSRSRTHHSWLANLEKRSQGDTDRLRYKRLVVMRRTSELLGKLIGPRGMQGLYGSYFMAYLPKSLFTSLFSTYRPALVISTTAHHAEAWPLTFFARRYGSKTLANILSWDNTTTKPLMDVSCDYYTVWSEEMRKELDYQFPHITTEAIVTGCPLFDVYYKKPYALSREEFLGKIGLSADKPYILYATNTPAAMPDECQVIKQYWAALNRSPLAGKVNMLVRLHPKESIEKYKSLDGVDGLVVTLAARPHWDRSDRWLPNHEDMSLLLNSMMHAAVSVNVASTMSLESFALNLPTINIAFKSSAQVKDLSSMWSFDMYHFSEHYHAIVDNGSVDLARSVDQLVAFTIENLKNSGRRKAAMLKTLTQKAAYCDGTSARRFFEAAETIVESEERRRQVVQSSANRASGAAVRQEIVAAE